MVIRLLVYLSDVRRRTWSYEIRTPNVCVADERVEGTSWSRGCQADVDLGLAERGCHVEVQIVGVEKLSE